MAYTEGNHYQPGEGWAVKPEEMLALEQAVFAELEARPPAAAGRPLTEQEVYDQARVRTRAFFDEADQVYWDRCVGPFTRIPNGWLWAVMAAGCLAAVMGSVLILGGFLRHPGPPAPPPVVSPR